MTLRDYPPQLRHILDGSLYGPLLASPDLERHRREWRACARALGRRRPADPELAKQFHLQWHVSSHFIRQLIDDDARVMDMLWAWLPRYAGPALDLCRGENIDRLEQGRMGSAWSDQEETAEMFASGWNAVGKGGVILRARVASEAIIAGPSDHSANWIREREFSVDWRKLDLSAIDGLPPSARDALLRGAGL